MANSSRISNTCHIPEDAESHLIISGNSQKEWIQTKTSELTSRGVLNYLLRIGTCIRRSRCTTFATPTSDYKSQCNQR